MISTPGPLPLGSFLPISVISTRDKSLDPTFCQEDDIQKLLKVLCLTTSPVWVSSWPCPLCTHYAEHCFPFRSHWMVCKNVFEASLKSFSMASSSPHFLFPWHHCLQPSWPNNTCQRLLQNPEPTKPGKPPSSASQPPSPLVSTSRFSNCHPNSHLWPSDNSSWPLPQWIPWTGSILTQCLRHYPRCMKSLLKLTGHQALSGKQPPKAWLRRVPQYTPTHVWSKLRHPVLWNFTWTLITE